MRCRDLWAPGLEPVAGINSDAQIRHMHARPGGAARVIFPQDPPPIPARSRRCRTGGTDLRCSRAITGDRPQVEPEAAFTGGRPRDHGRRGDRLAAGLVRWAAAAVARWAISSALMCLSRHIRPLFKIQQPLFDRRQPTLDRQAIGHKLNPKLRSQATSTRSWSSSGWRLVREMGYQQGLNMFEAAYSAAFQHPAAAVRPSLANS
jgi:hypothetical protein